MPSRLLTRTAPFILASAFLLPACGPRAIETARKEADHDYEWGRYEEAIPAYLEIIERHPGDWEAEYRYGMCLLKTGNLREARTHIETALANNPESDEVRRALAEVYFAMNERSRLVQLLRADASENSDVDTWLLLADYGRRWGDRDLELGSIQTAMNTYGTQQYLGYLAMADWLAKAGDENEAIRRTRQAYWLKPQHPAVRKALADRGLEPGPTTGYPPDDRIPAAAVTPNAKLAPGSTANAGGGGANEPK
jgi:tetratricopeptide (TPR) repeat protein